MKITTLVKSLLFAVAIVFAFSNAHAQNPRPRKSPHQTVNGTINGAQINITYGSPGVKGRTIWGELVPYDKPWRAGADEATILETDKEIKLQGKSLPAGKYTLFITPSQNKWTITINSETGQWGIKQTGEANFDPAKNVISFDVNPKKVNNTTEQLTYAINSQGISISWEHLVATVSVK